MRLLKVVISLLVPLALSACTASPHTKNAPSAPTSSAPILVPNNRTAASPIPAPPKDIVSIELPTSNTDNPTDISHNSSTYANNYTPYNICNIFNNGHAHFPANGANRVTVVMADSYQSAHAKLTQCLRGNNNQYTRVWTEEGYVGKTGVDYKSTASSAYGPYYAKSPIGSYPIISAFGEGNPGTVLPYQKLNERSKWSGKPGPNYDTYYEDTKTHHKDDEDLWYWMNRPRGYYRQSIVMQVNRPGDNSRPPAIFFHAGNFPSTGCVSVTIDIITRVMKTAQVGDLVQIGTIRDLVK